MWRLRINIDGTSSSVPEKKEHFSVDTLQIVKTILSSLLNRQFYASAAASEVCYLTKILLITKKRFTLNQEGSIKMLVPTNVLTKATKI